MVYVRDDRDVAKVHLHFPRGLNPCPCKGSAARLLQRARDCRAGSTFRARLPAPLPLGLCCQRLSRRRARRFAELHLACRASGSSSRKATGNGPSSSIPRARQGSRGKAVPSPSRSFEPSAAGCLAKVTAQSITPGPRVPAPTRDARAQRAGANVEPLARSQPSDPASPARRARGRSPRRNGPLIAD